MKLEELLIGQPDDGSYYIDVAGSETEATDKIQYWIRVEGGFITRCYLTKFDSCYWKGFNDE